MGQFFPKYEEIRIKHKGDIDVAAHEIGHFLDDGIEEALLIRTLEIAIENNITKWNYPKQILMVEKTNL